MEEKIKVAGIVRKSPTNRGVEENIEDQIKFITNWCNNKIGENNYYLKLFIDRNVKGDDPNRPALVNLFDTIKNYDYAVASEVDRYARFFMGLNWFMKYFTTNNGSSPHTGCKLFFVKGIGDLYDDDNTMNSDNFFMLYIYIGMAHKELLNIRIRTQRGRDRLSPEERAEKFKGRKKGSVTKETIDLKEAILKLRDKGLSIPSIAKKLNIGESRAKYIIYKVKL